MKKVVASLALPVVLVTAGTHWLRPDVENPAAVFPPAATRVSARAVDRPLRETLAEACALTDPVLRDEALQHLVSGVKAGLLPAALASLEDAPLGENDRAEMFARLVRRWAESDPRAATEFVVALPPGDARGLALENLVIAGRGSGDDLGWIETLPGGPDRERALATLAGEAIRTDPTEALRLAADLPESAANDELIRRAAMDWTTLDPVASVAWARRIADDGFRHQVLAGVAVAWAEADPVAAGNLAATEFAPGRLQDDTVVAVAQRWVQSDPEAAAAWVATFPTGPMKDAAVECIAPLWAKSDPAAASRWRETMGGPGRRFPD